MRYSCPKCKKILIWINSGIRCSCGYSEEWEDEEEEGTLEEEEDWKSKKFTSVNKARENSFVFPWTF